MLFVVVGVLFTASWDAHSKLGENSVVVVAGFLARVAVVLFSPYERRVVWVTVVVPAERGGDTNGYADGRDASEVLAWVAIVSPAERGVDVDVSF